MIVFFLNNNYNKAKIVIAITWLKNIMVCNVGLLNVLH